MNYKERKKTQRIKNCWKFRRVSKNLKSESKK